MRVGDIQLEIFMDILYSLKTNDFDPFDLTANVHGGGKF
jgi:hypothetical protein